MDVGVPAELCVEGGHRRVAGGGSGEDAAVGHLAAGLDAKCGEQQRIDRCVVDLDTDGHQIGPDRVCDVAAYGSDEYFGRCNRMHEQRR